MRVTTIATAILAGSAARPALAQLHALAKDAGLLYFGTAISPSDSSDAAYWKIANDVNTFGQWTPDNAQKWDSTEASRGSFSYSQADSLISRAKSNKQIMRCHTLVWYSQLPSWVSSGSWTKASMTSMLESHISNVVGHFKGKCYAWDVVNEALEEDGSYRKNVFFSVLGESYFPLAFKLAAAADPNAKLYYNDFYLEFMPVKADATVRVAKLIQAAGAPIHGIGLQGHITLGQTPSRENMTWTLNKFTALGLDVAYTELDMRIKPGPSDAAHLEQQAKEYEAVVGSCLDVPRCVGITVWGFGDARSWIKNGDPDLWDKSTRPKPAFSRVSALLASASGKRPPWNTAATGAVPTGTAAAAAVITGGGAMPVATPRR